MFHFPNGDADSHSLSIPFIASAICLRRLQVSHAIFYQDVLFSKAILAAHVLAPVLLSIHLRAAFKGHTVIFTYLLLTLLLNLKGKKWVKNPPEAASFSPVLTASCCS